jgi:hypothetical protein
VQPKLRPSLNRSCAGDHVARSSGFITRDHRRCHRADEGPILPAKLHDASVKHVGRQQLFASRVPVALASGREARGRCADQLPLVVPEQLP